MRFFILTMAQTHVAVVQMMVIPNPHPACHGGLCMGTVVAAASFTDVWIQLVEPPTSDPPASATHPYTCTQLQIKFNLRCLVLHIFHKKHIMSLNSVLFLTVAAVLKFCLIVAHKQLKPISQTVIFLFEVSCLYSFF